MRRILALMLCFLLCALAPAGALADVKLNPSQPVVLTVWHYYNGVQQQLFDTQVRQFNDTVGKEQGIIIEALSQGSVNNLYEKLISAVKGEAGADPIPDVCAAYADTVYEVDQLGMVADLSAYMTPEERAEYVDAFMLEGEMNTTGALKLFPVAKSTELMLVNKTVWDEFSAQTGASVEQLATWEGIVEVSRLYWQWTDAQTETPNDGKAFFGRDAFANYMIIGSLQLGAELFKAENGKAAINVDRNVMRRLWDNYAVPYVNGWFGAYGRFRSDDVKTGLLAALVGSTSGALYFPDRVTMDDGSSYAIESMTLPLPGFADTAPCAVQQGAGMFVHAGAPEREYAATVFLKWFTMTENNIAFSVNSGYLPVKKAANDMAVIEQAIARGNGSELLHSIVETGVQIVNGYRLYTNNAFENGNAVRNVVDTSMPKWVDEAVRQRDQLVASGMAWDEAVAQLTGGEAFDAWYTQLCEELNRALNVQ